VADEIIAVDSSVPVGASTTTARHYAAPQPGGALLVLGHGAGAGHTHPFMTAFARGLATRGVDVVTFNFLYMEQKRRMPDKAPLLESTFRAVIERVRASDALGARRLFIGGKSMGGRMATHLASQGVEGLAGVVALGYPLHPPGKPEQLRTAHLPGIAVPVLIVQGERDAFGTPAELAAAIATMSVPVALHVVQGGDHSLAVRGAAPAGRYDAVLRVIADWISAHV
jgi:uncharacterized protein